MFPTQDVLKEIPQMSTAPYQTCYLWYFRKRKMTCISFKDSFSYFMCFAYMHVCTCVCIGSACFMVLEFTRWGWGPWNWSLGRLCTIMSVLRTEPRSSARAPSDNWANSSAPDFCNFLRPAVFPRPPYEASDVPILLNRHTEIQ